MKSFYFILAFMFLTLIPYHSAKSNSQKIVIDNIVDVKDFKKLLRTKTNVLVCFVSNMKQSSQVIKVFKETASTVKGQGTMILVDCGSEAKKMCKKLKVFPEPFVIKHYKDGEFHKDYDRRDTVSSMVNFMRDPTGDIPWEEDSAASDVIHIADATNLAKFIKKEQKPLLIMFYAPWCGFCKTLKPEYAAAATELQGHSILAAIDVNRPENAVIRTQYNITGFPTMLYYLNGNMKYQYEGDNNKNGLVSFMKNPHMPAAKVKEPEWSDTDSEVVHLTNQSFDLVIKEEASVLVMFYAPWCGHCKRMKPEYEAAAAKMKASGVPGMLAALDATKEGTVATRFGVKGYPTVKYFVYGELKFDVNVRESQKIVEFMHNPKQPPPPPPPEKPWSEEASDVVHLTDEDFKPFLKKKKHVLVMFYAPWCGHCKKAKPEFTKAAQEFRDNLKVAFAAVDCTVYQSVCSSQGVKGYPTIKYFSYFKIVKPYDGGRTAAEFRSYMRKIDSPSADHTGGMPINAELNDQETVKDIWKLEGSNNIVQLSDGSFKKAIEENELTFTLFYAPWCHHCKVMKPAFDEAASILKKRNVNVKVAVVNCEANPETADELLISGFPQIKLFRKGGEFVTDFDGQQRTADEFVKFIETYVGGADKPQKKATEDKATAASKKKKKKKEEL